MINLRKHDPIADAVKDILQQEALKGNQHLIDKKKNNKVDAHDFKILRGEKKPAASNAYTQTSGYPSFKKKPAAVKEEETVEEGLKDMAKKAFKLVTGGSDEDQRKNLQKKMGVPQTGKKPEPKNEEFEQIDELSNNTLNSYVNKARGQVRASAGANPNNSHIGTDPKIANRARGAVKATNRLHGFGPVKEEVQGKTLRQFMENAFDYKTPRKPEPNGGSGVKQGSAYGGSKQKDKPEQATEKK